MAKNKTIHKLIIPESLRSDWVIERDDIDVEFGEESMLIKGSQLPAWILGSERLTSEKQIVVAVHNKRHARKVGGINAKTTWTMKVGSDVSGRALN